MKQAIALNWDTEALGIGLGAIAEGVTVPVAEAQPLRSECQHFLDCIATGQRPRSDRWNGVAVVEILEKATEALQHG